MNAVEKALKNIEELPTLPGIYTRLIDMIADPHSSSKDAANLISVDQAASLKILKAANSPLYGTRGKIDTLYRAVSLIGLEETRNLIFAMSVINLFENDRTIAEINPLILWKHSIAVGSIARIIAEKLNFSSIEDYFLAGILHDIGKLFFFKFMPLEYAAAMRYMNEIGCYPYEAETEKIGINHTEIGELIAEKWNLPENIRNVTRYHENGLVEGGFEKTTAVIHIANVASHMLLFSETNGMGLIPEPNINVWELLGLPDNLFDEIEQIVFESYETMFDSINFVA